jgi:hypothetical protein
MPDDYEMPSCHSGVQPKGSSLRLGDYCSAGVEHLPILLAVPRLITSSKFVSNTTTTGSLSGTIAIENAAHVKASQSIHCDYRHRVLYNSALQDFHADFLADRPHSGAHW